jgi:hypothetical protein
MKKRKDPDAWFEQVLAVAADPAASAWLKRSLREALNLDPVNAAKDATTLHTILSLRLNAILRDAVPAQGGKANGRLTAPERGGHERTETNGDKRQ